METDTVSCARPPSTPPRQAGLQLGMHVQRGQAPIESAIISNNSSLPGSPPGREMAGELAASLGALRLSPADSAPFAGVVPSSPGAQQGNDSDAAAALPATEPSPVAANAALAGMDDVLEALREV